MSTFAKPPCSNSSARRHGAALVLTAVLMTLTGCALLRAPHQMVTAVAPVKPQTAPLDLQIQLQRFADDSLARSTQALDEYARQVGTESARLEATRLKVICGSSVVSIASGPNPNANLLDMVAVTVLTRMTIEDHWITRTNGASFRPWHEVSRSLETNVLLLAGTFLSPAQINELRQAIVQWYERSPEARTAFFARPHELGSMVRTTREKSADLTSVFSLTNLDPTSGLDPAVREVTLTRLFAERAMYTAQRMPFLLRQQTELLGFQLAAQPAVQSALTNASKLSDSAERFAQTAEDISKVTVQLPDRISKERKEILDALEAQEGKLTLLAAQINQTLESGEKMSDSLNGTLISMDALMKRFGVGERSANQVPPTNANPFRILDYAETAARIGEMARELNLLITNVDASTPAVERLGRSTTADLRQLVDRSFRLGLVLILVFLAGAIGAGLVYRWLAAKLVRTSREAPAKQEAATQTR